MKIEKIIFLKTFKLRSMQRRRMSVFLTVCPITLCEAIMHLSTMFDEWRVQTSLCWWRAKLRNAVFDAKTRMRTKENVESGQ